MTLTFTLGRRVGVRATAGPWTALVEAGSDHEGGLLASAKASKRVDLPMARSDEVTVLGIHAANGQHSRWLWFGVAGQRQISGWRVAWWLPGRRDSHAEIPVAS